LLRWKAGVLLRFIRCVTKRWGWWGWTMKFEKENGPKKFLQNWMEKKIKWWLIVATKNQILKKLISIRVARLWRLKICTKVAASHFWTPLSSHWTMVMGESKG
jgi:hypothetical protein